MLVQWVAALVALEVVAELCLHRAAHDLAFLAAGVAAYVALALVFWWTMRKGGALVTLNTAWHCGTLVLVALAGAAVGEPLTARKLIGVGLAVAAVLVVGH